jgi:hypothetical protein
VPSADALEQAFHVYFDEIDRCVKAECYWSLLHVVVSLPDICGALESANGWATETKHVDWCGRYLPTDEILSAGDYRNIRNLVLHQGRTRTRTGRYYKFTRPTSTGNRVHRLMWSSEIVVLDVGELAKEIVAGVRGWFADLQSPPASERRANVAKNLQSLVIVKEQELPGIRGITFSATHTATSS